MSDLKLIENKIAEIREKIDPAQLLKENEEYKNLENLLNEIKDLVIYIHKGYEKWPDDLINVLNYLKEIIKKGILEIPDEEKKKKLEKYESKIYGLIEEIKRELLYIPDTLIDRLKREGYKIAKNKLLADDINKIGFRLLEKIRLGQRDEVLYMLLRVFTANDVKLPEPLIDAIKTRYDDSLFKSFMYAFLAPILGEKETEGGE
jgi:CRISPR-associated protein Cst1